MGMIIEIKFSINEQERKGESCVYVLIDSRMQKPGLAISQPEAVSTVAKSVSNAVFSTFATNSFHMIESRSAKALF